MTVGGGGGGEEHLGSEKHSEGAAATMVDISQLEGGNLRHKKVEIGDTLAECVFVPESQKMVFSGPVHLAPLQRKKLKPNITRKVVPLMEPDIGSNFGIEFIPQFILNILHTAIGSSSVMTEAHRQQLLHQQQIHHSQQLQVQQQHQQIQQHIIHHQQQQQQQQQLQQQQQQQQQQQLHQQQQQQQHQQQSGDGHLHAVDNSNIIRNGHNNNSNSFHTITTNNSDETTPSHIDALSAQRHTQPAPINSPQGPQAYANRASNAEADEEEVQEEEGEGVGDSGPAGQGPHPHAHAHPQNGHPRLSYGLSAHSSADSLYNSLSADPDDLYFSTNPHVGAHDTASSSDVSGLPVTVTEAYPLLRHSDGHSAGGDHDDTSHYRELDHRNNYHITDHRDNNTNNTTSHTIDNYNNNHHNNHHHINHHNDNHHNNFTNEDNNIPSRDLHEADTGMGEVGPAASLAAARLVSLNPAASII